MTLIDYGNEHLLTHGEKYLAVPADDSWIVVQPWENAIFVDETGENYYLHFYLY